jgi:hypothetical protein
MRAIKKIIIHCSASSWGSATVINQWHLQRGWNGIGYHYVINNGYPDATKKYYAGWDGKLEKGRDEEKIGAHCKGQNKDSLGICLVGLHRFSPKQLFITLPGLLKILLKKYNLKPKDVHGHCEYSSKTCPNIDIVNIRSLII